MPADVSGTGATPRLAAVSPDVLHQLADALNELMLPSNRGRLCAPVIAAAPGIIDGQAYFVLSTLARTGPVTVARLARHVGIDRSGTSRYADRLQEAGLLERRPDPADRRMSLLCLTPAVRCKDCARSSTDRASYYGSLRAPRYAEQGKR